MRKKNIAALFFAVLMLLLAGCEGGVPELVEQYQPLGEAFIEQLYAGDFDGSYEQFNDEMKINIPRKRWEDEIFPQMLEYGGVLKNVSFVSAYPAAGGTKLWLHMKQKNKLVSYCFVFDAENKITDFTFR